MRHRPEVGTVVWKVRWKKGQPQLATATVRAIRGGWVYYTDEDGDFHETGFQWSPSPEEALWAEAEQLIVQGYVEHLHSRPAGSRTSLRHAAAKIGKLMALMPERFDPNV